MINIVNTGEHENGEHRYNVMINLDPVAAFYHRREDGLAVCLHKAAEAVERQVLHGNRKD